VPLGDLFEPWYRDTYGHLITTMLAVSGDHEIAAEATDEAFSRAWRHWDQVRGMASPGGWTNRVALNVLRSQARLPPRLQLS
jgi:DNA-directed RNA polymerase specialized sigma24 family protein